MTKNFYNGVSKALQIKFADHLTIEAKRIDRGTHLPIFTHTVNWGVR